MESQLLNNCEHQWNKGLDVAENNKAFKLCAKCNLFEYITMEEYYGFEDYILEEKVKRIVNKILDERKTN